MNYYRRNREAILKKEHDKYHNGGGNIISKIKKSLRKEKEKGIEKGTNLKKKDKIKGSLDRYYRLKKEKEQNE